MSYNNVLRKAQTMRVFTKIKGELVVWEVSGVEIDEAIKLVRNEVGLKHRVPILCLVKY